MLETQKLIKKYLRKNHLNFILKLVKLYIKDLILIVKQNTNKIIVALDSNNIEAAKRIVHDYKHQRRTNTYYKCPQCGGYHLTTFKGSKKKREVLEGMIKATIKKDKN